MTLGLAQITNDAEATIKQIQEYGSYFDKFFITVADKDKEQFHKLKKFADSYGKPIKVKYFKWVNSFGKARLANQEMITTDYWFWMDTDDSIDHPELIRPLLQKQISLHIDIMFMTYDYYRGDSGESQAEHWRERIIRTGCGAKWFDTVCHETIDASGVRAERTKDIRILHHKSVEDMVKTVDRNRELLEADWQREKDPRTAYYLGMTNMTKGNFKEAVDFFMFLIDNGGWDEQKIVAWCAVADCYFFTQEYAKALVATNMALDLDPSHPDPYYQKVIIYSGSQQYDKAVEWAAIAMTKKPNENSMQLVDPTKYTHKGIFLAAQAYLLSGRVKEGFELFQKVKQIAPHFIAEINRETQTDWNKIFEESYYDNKAIEYVRYLVRYLQDYQGKPDKLFEALPKKIFADARLNPERVQVYPPKKWDTKTIAYYCGPAYEPWGPDKMENGIGGSEEAVIYLSRELTKLGWKVTVFCDREDEYFDFFGQDIDSPESHPVVYRPWTELNPFDEFDVFIAHRQPVNLNGVKARLRVLDLHDTIPEESVIQNDNNIDKIFVKSKWHRDLYPKIADDKFVVVGNGIVKEHFE